MRRIFKKYQRGGNIGGVGSRGQGNLPMLENNKTPDVTDMIKMRNNILKSIWLYAASKGFMIFKKNSVKAYLLSGPYLKCAA